MAPLSISATVVAFLMMITTQTTLASFFHHDRYQQQINDDSEESSEYNQPRNNHYAFNSLRQIGNFEENTFIFSPRQLRWFAYNSSGYLVASGRASGGRSYCPDIDRRCHTPVGTFRVQSKGSPWCKSAKYPIGEGGSPMPYCMFFKGGFAIHCSYEVPDYNASHGCIRVVPRDARWLSREFINVGTKVIVQPY